MSQQEPNQYNARKPWHVGEQKALASADSMFFREPESTSEPVTPTSGADTSGEGNTFEKRYNDLRPQFDRVTAENSQLKRKLQDLEAGNVPAAKLPETPEENEKFRTEKPEEFNRLVALVKYVSADVVQDVARLTETANKLRRDDALAQIQKAHPDVFELTRSKEFLEWIDSQSERVYNSVFKNPDDPKATIATLNAYKYEKAQAAQATESTQRQQQQGQDASNLIPSRNTVGGVESNKKIWTEAEAKAYLRSIKNPDKLEEAVKELEIANREGRIKR